ncbi:hypothetical protein [Aeromonas salmonicida]
MSFIFPFGSKVYISPLNDITSSLATRLGDSICFMGFIDGFKSGDRVIRPGQEGGYDYILVASPKYWKEISRQFDNNKVILYDKMNKEYIELVEYEKLIDEKLSVDVIFFPFNKSNVIDLSIVSRELKKINISSALVDVGSYKNINIQEGIIENNDVGYIPYDLVPYIDYRCLVTSIDWHSEYKTFFRNERARGIITIGMVDGIEDFEDSDYGVDRHAYETVEYVLLMGEDEKKYFKYKIDKTKVIGLPKLWNIYHSPVSFPDKTLVMINLNFTYGYFEDVRDMWLGQVIAACDALGYDYIISQHHADNGVIDAEKKSKKNVYDTIKSASIVVSRFSTVILETLASGKPVVYFNPHGEMVKIYKDPRGAFQVATTKSQLMNALRDGVDQKKDTQKRAHNFLDAKCFISSSYPPGEAAASYINSLLSTDNN